MTATSLPPQKAASSALPATNRWRLSSTHLRSILLFLTLCAAVSLLTPSRANTPPPVPSVNLTSDDQGRQFLNFTSIPGYHYVIEESTDNDSWQPAPAGLIYGNGTSHAYFLTQIPPATLDPDGDGTPNFILRSQKTTHVRMIHVFFLKDGGNRVRIDGMLPSPETGADPLPYFAMIPGNFPPRDANSGMHTILDYETATERYSVSVLLTGTNSLPPTLTPDQPEPPQGSSGDFIRDQLAADPSPLISLLTSPVPASTTPATSLAKRFYRVRVFQLDTNGNGLPDWWEHDQFGPLAAFALFGSAYYVDPLGDANHDGVSNHGHYLSGTAPSIDWDALAAATSGPFVGVRQLHSDGVQNYLRAPSGLYFRDDTGTPERALAWNARYKNLKVEQRWEYTFEGTTPKTGLNYLSFVKKQGHGVRFQSEVIEEPLQPAPGQPYSFSVRRFQHKNPEAIPFTLPGLATSGLSAIHFEEQRRFQRSTFSAPWTQYEWSNSTGKSSTPHAIAPALLGPWDFQFTFDHLKDSFTSSLQHITTFNGAEASNTTTSSPSYYGLTGSLALVNSSLGAEGAMDSLLYSLSVNNPSYYNGSETGNLSDVASYSFLGSTKVGPQRFLSAVTLGGRDLYGPSSWQHLTVPEGYLLPTIAPVSDVNPSGPTEIVAYDNSILQYRVKNPVPSSAVPVEVVWFESFHPDSNFDGVLDTQDGPPTSQMKSHKFRVGEKLTPRQYVDLGKRNRSETIDKWSAAADTGPHLGRFRLMEVEIVDANMVPVSKLKVGKMSDNEVLSGPEESAVLDIDKDPERFFVRVRGGAAMGGISIKVSTTDNPELVYNDTATQIDLHADGDDAISKSMLLVSDDVDDDYAVDGIADDATGDRTHKIQLGGNFKIEEITLGTSAWLMLGTKATVPVEKTVQIGIVILRHKAVASGGIPVISELAVKDELKEANERYAQAGIKLIYTISTVDPPSGVDLSDGLAEFTAVGSPTTEETALLTGVGVGTATTDDIQVFYVNYLANPNPHATSFGEAFGEAEFPAPLGENIILSAKFTPGGGLFPIHFNLAHELGHLLKRNRTHTSNIYQIMRRGGTSVTNKLGASKRFTADEVTLMRGSKHAK